MSGIRSERGNDWELSYKPDDALSRPPTRSGAVVVLPLADLQTDESTITSARPNKYCR